MKLFPALGSVFLCVFAHADTKAKEVVNYFAVATPFVFLIALFVVWINSEASFFHCYHTIKRFCSGGEAESERERHRNESGDASCAAAAASNEKSRANKSKQIMVLASERANGVTGLSRPVRRR